MMHQMPSKPGRDTGLFLRPADCGRIESAALSLSLHVGHSPSTFLKVLLDPHEPDSNGRGTRCKKCGGETRETLAVAPISLRELGLYRHGFASASPKPDHVAGPPTAASPGPGGSTVIVIA